MGLGSCCDLIVALDNKGQLLSLSRPVSYNPCARPSVAKGIAGHSHRVFTEFSMLSVSPQDAKSFLLRLRGSNLRQACTDCVAA